MLLHYLVKVEKPKMHVNTASDFNVNYKIAVTCNISDYLDRTSICMRRNGSLRASGENSDIIIQFRDPDFFIEINISAT